MNAKWVVAGLGLLASATALAAVNVKGDAAVDFFRDDLEVTVCFSGLGQENGTVDYDLSGLVDVRCTNRGGELVEAQDASFDASGTLDFDAGDFQKNGNVCVTIAEEVEDCPNPNWRLTITDFDVTRLDVVVSQGGEVVFDGSAL
jgi:hypothetical protein